MHVASASFKRVRELLEVPVKIVDRTHPDLMRAVANPLDVLRRLPGRDATVALARGRAVENYLRVRVREFSARNYPEPIRRLGERPRHLDQWIAARETRLGRCADVG
jgi:hypothetical protein